MSRLLKMCCFGAILVLPAPVVWNAWRADASPARTAPPVVLDKLHGMVRLPSGSFKMGSHAADESDQKPVHRVTLDRFWLDTHAVTNGEFSQFVEATGYETTAQQRGHSLVFDRKEKKWREVAGANWQRPQGPDDTLIGKERYPVVHVSWFDAVAYAAWAGKRLPTEAELEYAARAGLSDREYPWTDKRLAAQQANGWQGWFPDENRNLDGFAGIAPVGSFPANRWGLYDTAGNVWCWCSDWYGAESYGESALENPTGPKTGSERVRRGGSWLSADNHEGGLRLAQRSHASPHQSTNHTGFRCAR